MSAKEWKRLFDLLSKAVYSKGWTDPKQPYPEEWGWLVSGKLAASRVLIHVHGWTLDEVEDVTPPV